MNKFARIVRKPRAALLALSVAASNAMAQSTDPFQAALTEATGKVNEYAAALVGLAAVGVVFMIAIKYVKKIRGAA